jgi:Winged helix DNA-binding domain
MTRLSWDQVRRWRLERQHLAARAPKRRLLSVVSEVCGVHAQVQSSAELQVWARVEGVSPQDVRDALWTRRTLVKSWAQRGTLHLHSARDWPTYAAALGSHDRWWKGAWLRAIAMSAKELRATLDAIRDSLGGRPITREQLAEKVAGKVGPKSRERMLSGWGEMLKPASFEGSLLAGPPKGRSVTFVRPDRWLKGWTVQDGEEAVREVLRRFLAAYGPATREEFARWWGTQPAPAGRVIASMPPGELVEVEVGGARAWARAEDVAGMSAKRPRAGVTLVPGFDHYVVAFRPKEQLVDKRHMNKVFRAAGWISPVVLVDGRAVGVWAHERTGHDVEVSVQPFGRLTAPHRKAIAEEADRLGAFLGAEARVTWSGVPRSR